MGTTVEEFYTVMGKCSGKLNLTKKGSINYVKTVNEC